MPDVSQTSTLAEIKISELPVATSANPTDQLEANQAGTTRSITVSQVAATVPPPTWTAITGKPATFPPTLPINESDVTNLVSDLAAKAPLASPTFTGDPKAPTPATADNDTSIATTAYVKANLAALPAVTVPAGSVAYGGAGGAITGVLADFAWDATNKRLGIGTGAPAYTFHVKSGSNDLFTVDSSGIVGTAGAVRALLPFTWQAGGQWWSSITIGTTSGGYLGLFGGTGAPTCSTFGAYGSLYVNASSPGIPYYNIDGSTGWDQLVGLTATQTLVNKSATTPPTADNTTKIATTAYVKANIPTALPPNGSAGGDLAGSYPNPTIKPSVTNGQVLTTVAGVAAWAANAGGPPSGAAGGVLAGTYPNPTAGPGIKYLYSEQVLGVAAQQLVVTIPANTKLVMLDFALNTVSGSNDAGIALQGMQSGTPLGGTSYFSVLTVNTGAAPAGSSQIGSAQWNLASASMIRGTINLNAFPAAWFMSGTGYGFQSAGTYLGLTWAGQLTVTASTITGFRLASMSPTNWNIGSYLRCLVVT